MTNEPQPIVNRQPRYTHRVLPPYRFLPGVSASTQPHPVRDGGYLAGHEGLDEPMLTAEQWRDQSTYLYGVDLFNLAYFWEAHEAWEQLWHATNDPIQRQFIQALIQLAAAMLKRHQRKMRGVRFLLGRAIIRLHAVRDGGHLQDGRWYMGLDVIDYLLFLERLAEDFARDAEGALARFERPLALRPAGTE